MRDYRINIDSSFALVLAIVFIVLKLCGVITWSWLWVLSPIWIDIALVLLIVLIVFIRNIKTINRKRRRL